MTQPTRTKKALPPGSLNFPMPTGDSPGTKYLIGAVLVAGKNDCQCEACQLLKKFRDELGTALLKEETPGGD